MSEVCSTDQQSHLYQSSMEESEARLKYIRQRIERVEHVGFGDRAKAKTTFKELLEGINDFSHYNFDTEGNAKWKDRNGAPTKSEIGKLQTLRCVLFWVNTLAQARVERVGFYPNEWTSTQQDFTADMGSTVASLTPYGSILHLASSKTRYADSADRIWADRSRLKFEIGASERRSALLKLEAPNVSIDLDAIPALVECVAQSKIAQPDEQHAAGINALGLKPLCDAIVQWSRNLDPDGPSEHLQSLDHKEEAMTFAWGEDERRGDHTMSLAERSLFRGLFPGIF